MTADALTKVVMAAGVDAEPVLRRYGAAAYLYESGGWRILEHRSEEWEPVFGEGDVTKL